MSTPLRRNPYFIAVLLLVAVWVAFYGWLAIRRHQAHQSAAMDLGYTDQVVWNTLHGRPFEFSTYESAPIYLSRETFAHTDNLLGFHAELLLAPIALAYLVHSGPETLLVLQAIVVGLGALPAFWLAREHLRSDIAGLAFAVAYLLAPALQGAVLSDFHAIALTASLLLWAFFFLDAGRLIAYFCCIIAVILAKEDAPLIIALFGLLIAWRSELRRVGLATFVLGTSWFFIANRLILPGFSGLSRPPFAERLALFGTTPEASVKAMLRHPMLPATWLVKPEILLYLGGLLSTTGFTSVFALPLLLPVAPILAVNVFSRWSWTYSGGAHYSATVVPFIILSGIYGFGWLTERLAKSGRLRRADIIVGLSAVVFASALAHHLLVGVSPLTRDFEPPRVTAHEQIGEEMMARIPAGAAVSAQSDLYPHLSQRRKAYLFPVVSDAEYVLVDVAGSTYPPAADAHFRAIQALLESGEFGIEEAKDGYLLLRRGVEGRLEGERLASFLTFARAGEDALRFAAGARFGDALELVGYDYEIRPVVHATERPATITTYWRALRPLNADYDFRFFFTRGDGAVVNQYDGPLATTLWYPTSGWQDGEIVRVETPVLSVGRLNDALVAVVVSGDGGADSAEWLLPTAMPDGGSENIVGDGTLFRIFSFREAPG